MRDITSSTWENQCQVGSITEAKSESATDGTPLNLKLISMSEHLRILPNLASLLIFAGPEISKLILQIVPDDPNFYHVASNADIIDNNYEKSRS